MKRQRGTTLGANSKKGFTLPEIIISATLGVVVMTGMLSTVLSFARASYAVGFYVDMESESRKALELFGEDVRQAKYANWNNSPNSVTLKVVVVTATGYTTEDRTYTYDTANHKLTRTTPSGSTDLVTNITTCYMYGYGLTSDPNNPDNSLPVFDPTSNTSAVTWATVSNNTKQIQLSIISTRGSGILTQSTQKVISAKFILRNKTSAF